MAVGMAFLLSTGLDTNDLIGGDEGYYGVMAKNVTQGPSHLANPSLSPLGPPGDKPFLYPLILAGAMKVGGANEFSLRVVNVVLGVLTVLLLVVVGREMGNFEAGAWAGLLYLFTPMLGYTSRAVAAETSLVAFTLAGAGLFLRGWRKKRGLACFGAGCFFGLGFLVKLWLALIPAAAVVGGCLLAGALTGFKKPEVLKWWRGLLAVGLGFAAVGSVQLLLVWALTPENLDHWLDVYFGFSLFGRVSGTQFADYWHHPWHYYLLLLGRSISLWLPCVFLGFVALAHSGEWFRSRTRARIILTIWLVPLLPMSLMSVKSGNYLLPLVPGLVLWAGHGLSWLRFHLNQGRVPKKPLLLVAGLTVVSCLLTQVSLSEGLLRPQLRHPIPPLIQVLWATAFVMMAILPESRPRLLRTTVLGCLALSLLAGLGRNLQLVRSRDHVTGFRQVAEELAAGLQDVDPQTPCFISPEWPAMSFYTFRSGRYWESPYVPADRSYTLAALRGLEPFFFVVDSRKPRLYGGYPDAEALATIETEGYLLRSESLDDKPTLRIYVNEALHRVMVAQRQG